MQQAAHKNGERVAGTREQITEAFRCWCGVIEDLMTEKVAKEGTEEAKHKLKENWARPRRGKVEEPVAVTTKRRKPHAYDSCRVRKLRRVIRRARQAERQPDSASTRLSPRTR